jgi:hypothetical protein
MSFVFGSTHTLEIMAAWATCFAACSSLLTMILGVDVQGRGALGRFA